MKIKKKVTNVFVADDGKEFETESECIIYETQILDKIKYFCVDFDFDLCEGRGWTNNAYIAVIPVRDTNAKDIVFEYALRNYGDGHYLKPGVQGYGAEKTFYVREISKKTYDAHEGIQWPAFKSEPEQILLSPFPVIGFPSPYNYTKEWNILY